jgi:hypothetical protein
MDLVLERFQTTYKSDIAISDDIQLLWDDIYALLRLEALLLLAEKYNSAVVYGE